MLVNKVIVRPQPNNDFIGNYKVRDNYDPMKQVSSLGTVMQVPTKLVCDHTNFRHLMRLHLLSQRQLDEVKDINHRSLHWLPEMELNVGDKVLFGYAVHLKKKDTSFPEVLMMDYTNVFAKIVDGKPQMLNGYVLVNPHSNTEGVVIHAPVKKNKAYLSERIVTDAEVKEGDTIIFNKSTWRPINHEIYPIFDNGLTLWAMQACNIIAIL